MTEPTDAELEALLVDKAPILALIGANVRTAVVKAMREAFAKFGTPPAVAGEPMTARELADRVARGERWRIASTPQSQAGAVPLTREQVKAILTECGYDGASAQHRADFINGLRHGEAAHGIKGGQHGADN